MNSDQNRQSLVFADGYSYTEVFEAPDTTEMPNNRFISVFHAFFSPDADKVEVEATPTAECETVAVETAIRNA